MAFEIQFYYLLAIKYLNDIQFSKNLQEIMSLLNLIINESRERE